MKEPIGEYFNGVNDIFSSFLAMEMKISQLRKYENACAKSGPLTHSLIDLFTYLAHFIIINTFDNAPIFNIRNGILNWNLSIFFITNGNG
jgi:hypothetical protein